jgi:anhydro-N-acetylmuramic acid kinase
LNPRVIGLMSGTSADGIDAVLLGLPGFPELGSNLTAPRLEEFAMPRIKVLEHSYTPYSDGLRDAVLEAMRGEMKTADLAQLHFALGEAYAKSAKVFAKDAQLVSSHGQTVFHIPRLDESRGWHTRATLQLGEASVIAEETGLPVIADFRPADLVAGGQAAPLVPFADRVIFAENGVRRAIHNLGGISNLTYLPGLELENVVAFDTGPANCLIDEAAGLFKKRYDENGEIAAGGKIEKGLLKVWLRNAYLEMSPPKSTGREVWNLQNLAGVFELAPQDIVSSVTAFSAQTGRSDRCRWWRIQSNLDASHARSTQRNSSHDVRGIPICPTRLELEHPRSRCICRTRVLRLSRLGEHDPTHDRSASRRHCWKTHATRSGLT